ncbi:6-cysteine protein [Plasmodium gonderi]|uniref:6-cysteine protein n=1 Tax=Plasmodium gonderi TaxID=77519 RepID=A0A1Y1JFK2_PLAGO|nr:6-cysteine protein [Plasmodium gonderi]GAW79223.1 6-cysteine protein [Plasmodium gonderi]
MGRMHTYLQGVTNMLFFILLYYFFSFFVLFCFFFFKMRKVFYPLLVTVYIFLYLYSPVYALYFKELELGNYYICNLDDYPKEHCVIDYDPNKIIKFLCPIVRDAREKEKMIYDSTTCFRYKGIKDRFIINNREEPINKTLPGIILENQVQFDRYNLGIYIMPIMLKEDVNIVCICDTKRENEGITPYIKINIKKSNSITNGDSTEGYVKGCDFGNNQGEYQFLTKSLSYKENFICEIEANPGDILGINCINYNDNHQEKDVKLEPSNCFSTVFFSMYTLSNIKTNINNIFPEAQYYPEFSAYPKDPNFYKFSTTSYLWIPNYVPHEFYFFCSCKYAQINATALYRVKSSIPDESVE